MAAAYLFGITKNHPFLDGNKRAGAGAAVVFLELNGYECAPRMTKSRRDHRAHRRQSGDARRAGSVLSRAGGGVVITESEPKRLVTWASPPGRSDEPMLRNMRMTGRALSEQTHWKRSLFVFFASTERHCRSAPRAANRRHESRSQLTNDRRSAWAARRWRSGGDAHVTGHVPNSHLRMVHTHHYQPAQKGSHRYEASGSRHRLRQLRRFSGADTPA